MIRLHREAEQAQSRLALTKELKVEENLNLVKVAPQLEEEIRKLQEIQT